MDNPQPKVLIKKADRVPDAEKKAFSFQNSQGEPILSFSDKACYYRAINRPRVDKLFDESHQIFPKDPQEGWKINKKARALWHEIIRESNKF